MKAALYVRISQDRTGEALGVTRQLEDCKTLAAQLGWEITEVYTDNDISAVSGKTRPAYQKMLADVAAGHITAIVAWHPDRLYRRAKDLGPLVDVCKTHNVHIATVRAGNVDLTTPSGRMIAGILANVATYEGEAKADRWKRSVRQSREAGVFPPSGPRMFGYTREGEIVEEEAEVVRWIAKEILDGRALLNICRKLEEQGVTTTRGAPWMGSGLRHLMTNPKAAGFVTLGGDIVGEGNWTPLLDRDTWESVRAVLGTNGKRKASPRVALLVGLMHCGRCGAKMSTGSRSQAAGKPTARTYRCPAPFERVADSCGSVAGVAEQIEEIVEGYAKARWEAWTPGEARVAELRGQPSAVLGELAEYEARVVELEAQLDEPGVPVATILRAIDRAKEKVGELSSQLVTVTPVIRDAAAPWPDDLGRRRALIEQVVERVDLDPQRKGVARNRFDMTRVRITGRGGP